MERQHQLTPNVSVHWGKTPLDWWYVRVTESPDNANYSYPVGYSYAPNLRDAYREATQWARFTGRKLH